MIPSAHSTLLKAETAYPEQQPSETYRIDFEHGRITGRVDRLEAVKQAIVKILQTERFSHLIYSWNYGIETNAVFGRSYAVMESELRRVLKEALMQDRRITNLKDIIMAKRGSRSAAVAFTAETIFGDVPIETEVTGSV